MSLQSKLPDVGTTIFTIMSRLAAEHNAINLSQGFPDFDADPALILAVSEAMMAGCLILKRRSQLLQEEHKHCIPSSAL